MNPIFKTFVATSLAITSQVFSTFTPSKVEANTPSPSDWENYLFEDSRSKRTDAFLIWQNGKITFERYARGYSKDSVHNLWSIAKSISVTLLGIAEKNNFLSRNDLAHLYYNGLAQAEKKKITVSHLLRMSSGIDFKEGYINPFASDVIKMLYMNSKDMAAFTSDLNLKANPDERFNYSSGETNILMAVLRGALGEKVYSDYPWRALFDPLEIKSATFERDQGGNFVGSSYVSMTARDLLKVGIFYLNKGKIDDKELLPADWLEYVGTIAPAFLKTKLPFWERHRTYGAGFYLNKSSPANGIKSIYPMMPEDMLMAMGHEGQLMAIIPSQKTVMIRLADDSGGFSLKKFFELYTQPKTGAENTAPIRNSLEEPSAPQTQLQASPKNNFNLDMGFAQSSANPFQMISSLTSKELCSCLFVEKREPNFCLDKVKQWFPAGEILWDLENRTVTSQWGSFTAKSSWTEPRYGCVLEN